jgi:hypothetical protein
MHELTMYSKPGCHLCDDMKAAIDRIATRVPLTLRIVDITGNAQLESEYGLEIPVLLIDGHKAAKYRVDEWVLEQRLRR